MIKRYEQFSAAISTIYHDIQRIERTQMSKYGLKGPHAQCLLAMSCCPGGITSARLCEACDKDKAAISRTVAELTQRGLVHREDSRYRARLTLTEEGEALARQVTEVANRAVEQAGAGLDDEMRAQFYSILGLIAGNLHTICKNGLNQDDKENTL